MEANMIDIEVAYALPRQQFLIQEKVAEGCTIAEALSQSEIHQLVPHIEIIDGKVGIFGKVVKMNQILKAPKNSQFNLPPVLSFDLKCS